MESHNEQQNVKSTTLSTTWASFWYQLTKHKYHEDYLIKVNNYTSDGFVTGS